MYVIALSSILLVWYKSAPKVSKYLTASNFPAWHANKNAEFLQLSWTFGSAYFSSIRYFKIWSPVSKNFAVK